jgi:hypothetical protein
MPISTVIPLTLDFLGTLLIGYAVLKVHSRIGKEHKIDKHVWQTIKKERTITYIGLILIVLGFIFNFV